MSQYLIILNIYYLAELYHVRRHKDLLHVGLLKVHLPSVHELYQHLYKYTLNVKGSSVNEPYQHLYKVHVVNKVLFPCVPLTQSLADNCTVNL